VMLVCTTSLGIQSILLKIFSSFYFSIIVAASLFLMLGFLWKYYKSPTSLKNILYRAMVFLVILRFFIPIMAITSDGLYKAFLESTYIESKQQLEKSNATIASISEDNQKMNNEEKDISWLEMMSNSIDSAIDSINVDKHVEQLKIEAENLTNHIINLIVVFTMQTILFPLIFIWLSMKLIKANFSFRFVS
jgi:hypothetical protein